MSRWTEQYKAHPFHADWTRLTEVVNAAMPDSADVAAAQEIARLKKVLEFVRGVLDNQDPEIVHPNFLSNLHSYVQSASGEVTTYFSNKSIGHLHNANAQADLLVGVAIQSPFVAFGPTKAGLTKAAVQYADAMDRHAVSYANTIDRMLADAMGQVTALGADVTEANEEVTKLDDRLATVETTVHTQLSTFNSTFQASEAARTLGYDNWLAKFQDRGVVDYTKLTETNAVGLLAMQSFQDDAEKVLGTVIDTAQAGAYAKYANDEKKSANGFRWFAIASMAAAALVLFAPEVIHWVQLASNYTVDWKQAMYRLPFSLVLFAPALYLAKESSRHRTNEVVNRRRQHILTTIGPYLALFDKDKADAIKAEVAKSIFSDNLPVYEDKSPDAGVVALQFSQLLTTLTKAK